MVEAPCGLTVWVRIGIGGGSGRSLTVAVLCDRDYEEAPDLQCSTA